MVFIGSGPDGGKGANRKTVKFRSLLDRVEATIRDFYLDLTSEEKSDLRTYLRAYIRLHKDNRKYKMRFAVLRQELDAFISNQPANANVMQAGNKSFPTVDQMLSVVNKIDPLD
jgi:hypothetical protein